MCIHKIAHFKPSSLEAVTPGTSTIASLQQVVMLINSSGFAQSFTIAYVPMNLVLRLVNDVITVYLRPIFLLPYLLSPSFLSFLRRLPSLLDTALS